MKGGRLDNGELNFVANKRMLFNMYHFIDVANAEATIQSDKDRILSCIQESPGGIDWLNSKVKGLINGAYACESVVQLAAFGDEHALSTMLALPFAIHSAASAGYLKLLVVILLDGSNIHKTNNEGLTAMMCAATGGHTGCLEVLLQRNASDVHITRSNGMNAFLMAAEGGHVACLNLLLSNGSNIHETNGGRQTSLMLAAARGHFDCVDLLLQQGCDVYWHDWIGSTALMLAAEHGHTKCVDLLLRHGSDLNKKSNCDEFTALIQAAQGGHTSCVDLLLQRGSDVHIKGKHGRTAFMRAAQGGHTACVDLLLLCGSDMHSQDKYGSTALMLAVEGGHKYCVDLLLQRGSNCHSQDKNGWNALMHVADNIACLSLLLHAIIMKFKDDIPVSLHCDSTRAVGKLLRIMEDIPSEQVITFKLCLKIVTVACSCRWLLQDFCPCL